ncbi:uncharacterized protein LOC112560780 [Pomacea canaliculata]|uniref:uncharacterized protein LOC112560780 n=1 Tax=Pomacea canaliculata TaxID=400727 RepID=UPI000D72828A|nr:uncharacterized protein LOC112560780 [Pomacea canaliculata]XP_025088625.1 uncharacterized protein LOC112560780 [Pomacea canaliculata]
MGEILATSVTSVRPCFACRPTTRGETLLPASRGAGHQLWDGRWCEAGECVSNARAPVIGSCPFGDQLVRINGQECRRAVAARPALCNNARVRQICCGTCRAPRSQAAGIGIPGCPVGDGVPGCRADLCQSLGHDGTPYARDCCGTCRFNPTQWTCTDAAGGVDGVQCNQAILRVEFKAVTTRPWLLCAVPAVRNSVTTVSPEAASTVTPSHGSAPTSPPRTSHAPPSSDSCAVALASPPIILRAEVERPGGHLSSSRCWPLP